MPMPTDVTQSIPALQPILHMNGTGKRALFDEQKRIAHGLNDLLDLTDEVTIHPRDYYPYGVDADKRYQQAIASHRRAVDYLQAVADYVQNTMMHIRKDAGITPRDV